MCQPDFPLQLLPERSFLEILPKVRRVCHKAPYRDRALFPPSLSLSLGTLTGDKRDKHCLFTLHTQSTVCSICLCMFISLSREIGHQLNWFGASAPLAGHDTLQSGSSYPKCGSSHIIRNYLFLEQRLITLINWGLSAWLGTCVVNLVALGVTHRYHQPWITSPICHTKYAVGSDDYEDNLKEVFDGDLLKVVLDDLWSQDTITH